MSKSFHKEHWIALFILGILLVSFVSVPLSVLVQSAGGKSLWNPDWRHRKAITINHALVAATLANFPVLIDIDDADLASSAQPDGDDILFTDSGGVQLSHEIELYNAGHLVAWVKVPSLSSSEDTVLYMYYGNDGAANQEDASGVWDANFMMVQHLNEVSGTHYDSTVHGNDGTPQGGVSQDTAGKVDGADSFDGSNDYITMPHSSTLTGFTEAFTCEAWVNFDTTSTRMALLNKWQTTGNQRAWFLEYHNINRLGFFVSQTGGAYPYYYANSFRPAAGTWYHLVVVWWSGRPAAFYVNGAQIPTTTSTGTVTSIYNNPSAPLDVGRSAYSTDRYFDGVIDEVRISNQARSGEWISTSYANQMNPSDFYTVGPEESSGNPTVFNPFPLDGTTNVPTSLSWLSFDLVDPNGDLMNYSVSTHPYIGGDVGLNRGDGTYFVSVSGLSYSTTYTWHVNATDGLGWTNVTYTFTTEFAPLPPVVSDPYPANGTANVPLSLEELSCYVSDPNGDVMNISVTTSPDVGFSEGLGIPDTWFTVPVSGLDYSTTYVWHVNATDGILWTNVTYCFTTRSELNVQRKALAINHSLVAETVVNFPVMIDLTDSDLANEAQPDGSDVYFTDSGGVQLSHEIEFYSAGHLIAWVRIPVLSSSEDTRLYMCYGDPGAGDPENPEAVWDANFMMVQHFNEASGTHFDSTTNNNDGSALNGVVQNATGMIDGADDFDGSDDCVIVPHSNTITGFSQAFTTSCWIKMDSITGRRTIMNKWNTNNQRAWYVDYDSARGANTLGLFVSADGSSYSYWYAAFGPVAGNWYHIAIVWQSGQQPIFYINGAAVTATTTTARSNIYNNALEPLYIGRSYTSGRYFDGIIDEVRVSNVARSAQWISTCYINQMNPSAFVTIAEPTPPEVVTHVPMADATDVLVATTITVTFSEPMDRDTTENAFSISPSISGSFSWSLGDTVMTFTPTSVLDYETVYAVTLATAAMDKEGEHMTATYTWSFTTTVEPPPTVVGHVPLADAVGVSVTATISVTFSEAMDRVATEAAFFINGSVSGTFTWSSDNTTLVFTPSSNLAVNTTYTVTISTGAMNMQGQHMQEPHVWSFITGTPPYVTAVTPDINGTDVSRGTTIRVTFSEAMDRASVEHAFSIVPWVNGSFSWNSASTRITFTPDSLLTPLTLFTVTMSTEAMDLQDEHMTAPYSWSFTTAPSSAPYVVSTTPAPGEIDVTYTIWGVKFSEPMAGAMTTAAFSINVTGTKGRDFSIDFRWVNSSYVDFYLAPLSSFRGYNVTISTAALDAQGENMTSKYTWSFRSGDVSSPITLKWAASVSGGTGESSPLIGDLTSDLGEEVIYVGVDYVRCLSGTTGALIWSYYDDAIGWNVQPQMGDINNDGKFEIVVPLYSPTGILVLRADGSLYWKRTGIGGSSYTSKPLIVDPDGDGYWMIFCAPEDVRGYSTTNTYTARIWAFNYDGREIKNGLWGTAEGTRSATGGYNGNYYQWFAWRPCSGGFAMADTDNDGLFELYQNDRHMYYGDGGFGKGTICWEWSPTTQSLVQKWYQPDMLVSSHTPILVDVNKDGVLDVVAAHMRGGIAAFDSMTGTEIKKDYNLGLPSHYQPVVYDIDRDGNLEILLADGDHPGNSPPDIVVFDLVEWKIDARMYVGPCKFPPTVGEVTGDGIMDIIAVSDRGLYVFDGSHDPSVDHTYPVQVVWYDPGRYQCMYAVVQDIDNDGKNEIVITSSAYRVYAFDTPAPATIPRPRSEVQYYNERRTGVAEYVPPVFYDRTAPIVSDPTPSREATNVSLSLSQLRFTLTDLQGDLMNYAVTADFPVDAADLIGLNKGGGTYYVDVIGPLDYHRKYTWSVSVTDGVHWNNKTYTFTTPDGIPPGSPPTHDPPLLASSGTGDYQNATSRDLICTSQNSYDPDGEDVTSIYRWLRNGQPIANLIMPFDTDSLTTAKDYSGYSNNAQIHGATWTSDGKIGGAYSLDGIDDYIVIPDGGAGYYNGRIYPSNLGGQGNWYQLTVEMWINLPALSTKESTRILMKIPSYEIGLGSVGGSTRANNRLTAAVWLDNPDSGDNAGPPNSSPKATEYWSVSAPTSTPLSTNTWYHVALTYKDGGGTGNSVLTLYINGVAVTTSTSRTTRGPIKASSGEPLFIGWYDYFKGMIDEVRIYSRCLSAEQISHRYNETKDGLTSSSTLSHSEIWAGETWTCQVIPNDAHQDGTARTSNPLLVLPGPQVPPVASSVQVWGQTSLSTSRVWSNETIIAVYTYFDENDDPEVFGGSFGTYIRWYQNGTHVPALDNLTSLSTSVTAAHEDWYFEIKPGDGYGVAADWIRSTNKVIVNSPPVVTSYSPQYGYSLTHIVLTIGQSQTFSFTYWEMDGDPVTILWQVDGVTMAENVTSFTWTATATGSFTIRARIYDTGYGSTYTTQSWNVVVR